MGIAKELFEPDPPLPLKLFTDDESPVSGAKSHRIADPVSPLAAFGQLVAREFADPTVTARDKERAFTEMTVNEFYDRWLRKDREAKLDPKTIQLDDESLAWLRSVGRPAAWPSDQPWAGPPIACYTTAWLNSLAAESKSKGIAVNTVGKYLRHIRIMFNAAAKLDLIKKIAVEVPTEDVEARPFSLDEVQHIYRRLAAEPVMQVAFVLALGTGARFSDLFWIQWSEVDFQKRQIAFTAEKTDKFQVLPLTKIPLLHLNRLPKREPPFASLVDQSIDPAWRGEARYIRRLHRRWRQLTGFRAPPRLKRDWPAGAVPHPWHSARATAAVWIETQVSKSASKLLGHTEQGGERVTKMHYLVPRVSVDLRAAAEAIEWPDCFLEIVPIAGRPLQQSLFN